MFVLYLFRADCRKTVLHFFVDRGIYLNENERLFTVDVFCHKILHIRAGNAGNLVVVGVIIILARCAPPETQRIEQPRCRLRYANIVVAQTAGNRFDFFLGKIFLVARNIRQNLFAHRFFQQQNALGNLLRRIEHNCAKIQISRRARCAVAS